jgi:hypothetical protein
VIKKNIGGIFYSPAWKASVIKHFPIEMWPSLLGKAYNLNVPSGVRRLKQPTTLCSSNIRIIFALLKSVLHLPGDIAEAGVYQGNSLLSIGLYLHQRQLPFKKIVFGCDSFMGFNESVLDEIALGGDFDGEKRVGGFSDTSYEALRSKVEKLGLERNVQLVPGYFQQSLASLENHRFCFVHLDCDIYESYQVCLKFFYPRMVPGGVILFDEYNDPHWPGCNKAVDEFFRNRLEVPMEISQNNYLKYYVRKEQASR